VARVLNDLWAASPMQFDWSRPSPAYGVLIVRPPMQPLAGVEPLCTLHQPPSLPQPGQSEGALLFVDLETQRVLERQETIAQVLFQRIRPAVGGKKPMTERIVVVLPTPLRPNRHTHSPAATCSEIPNSTRERPYAECNSSITRSCGWAVIARVSVHAPNKPAALQGRCAHPGVALRR
jgi:hypothetical protein